MTTVTPVAGPFYFAWINPPDPIAMRNGTAFDPTVHNRMDEYIFTLDIGEKEGDKPTLDLTIRNPHVGLLNSARKQWAWLSRSDDGVTFTPLFCGRLIAAPKDIFKEKISIQLVAWPIDYFEQIQALAEQIKTTGPYDPVFIDETKRDDPDTVLEAVSGLWHVDPVTHVCSVADIVNGDDGSVTVTQDQHLYNAMEVNFDQASQITSILMVATVSWNQTGQGYIDMGNNVISSYAGDAIIGDWPKPLSPLGGGYTVAFANAYDALGISHAVTATASGSWTNREKTHEDGDTLSLNWSVTMPSLGGTVGGIPSGGVILTEDIQPGFLDPFAVDGDGDPDPTNIPMHLNVTYAFCPVWQVNTSLVLQYRDLTRQRTERLQMLLTSDLQPILVDPLVTQDSEVITKQGADVSLPILDLLNWTTVAGRLVEIDTIVFPDDPSIPSQRTAQIAVQSGTAGTVEPDFSDVPGETTVDGTVVWASLGTPNPPETAYDWTAATNVPAGEVILPRKPLYITWQVLTLPGRQQVPQIGSQVSRGQLIQGNNGFFFVCTTPGLTALTEPNWPGTYASTVQDGSVTWTCLGNTVPDGKTHYIAVRGGTTGAEFMIPPFNPALHAQTADNTVIWAAIGVGDLPIGGTPGDTWGRTYFDTTRGLQSVEYLVSIMRARALMKSRAVTLDFQPIDPFGLGSQMSLRKTAVVYDTRLAGGLAEGKIIEVHRACDGGSGQETCHVQIGCCIGKDTAVRADSGQPVYVDGYVNGYQQRTGTVVLLDSSDVGYTPPVISPSDDGLVFPLDKSQIVISEGVLGDFSKQAGAVSSALGAMAQAARLTQFPSNSLSYATWVQQQIQQLSANSVQRATLLNPIWYDATLKPLTGLVFNNSCVVTLTPLTAPKGIDLTGISEDYTDIPQITFPQSVTPPPNGPMSSLFIDSDIFYFPSISGGDKSILPSSTNFADTFYVPKLTGGSSGAGFQLGDVPFTSNSLWNTPVPDGATFTPLAWPATTGFNYSANWNQYSAPVYISSPSDPLCTVNYGAGQGYPAGSVQLNIPSGATGAPGSDGEIVIIDGTTVWNFWVFSRTSDTTATANQQGHCDVITGTGFGNFSGGQGAGIMACGSSGLGGMLIQAETDAGPIMHALQLSPLYTLVKPGFVAPAIRGDGNTSSGIVQEGDLLAIPPSTAMPTGLSTIGQQIFTALKTYGCYVVDVSGGDSTLRMQQNAYNQTVADNAWHDSNKIIPLLQKVNV